MSLSDFNSTLRAFLAPDHMEAIRRGWADPRDAGSWVTEAVRASERLFRESPPAWIERMDADGEAWRMWGPTLSPSYLFDGTREPESLVFGSGVSLVEQGVRLCEKGEVTWLGDPWRIETFSFETREAIEALSIADADMKNGDLVGRSGLMRPLELYLNTPKRWESDKSKSSLGERVDVVDGSRRGVLASLADLSGPHGFPDCSVRWRLHIRWRAALYLRQRRMDPPVAKPDSLIENADMNALKDGPPVDTKALALTIASALTERGAKDRELYRLKSYRASGPNIPTALKNAVAQRVTEVSGLSFSPSSAYNALRDGGFVLPDDLMLTMKRSAPEKK